MPRVAAFAAEARFPHSGASMDGDGCPLAMGDGQGVPAEVGALVNRRYRKMLTNSDGACGIHALAAIARAACGMQIREVSCDGRSARLQRKCAEIAAMLQRWMS